MWRHVFYCCRNHVPITKIPKLSDHTSPRRIISAIPAEGDLAEADLAQVALAKVILAQTSTATAGFGEPSLVVVVFAKAGALLAEAEAILTYPPPPPLLTVSAATPHHVIVAVVGAVVVAVTIESPPLSRAFVVAMTVAIVSALTAAPVPSAALTAVPVSPATLTAASVPSMALVGSPTAVASPTSRV